jgi:hypothetical protein
METPTIIYTVQPVHKWCTENCMKINIIKTNIISFTRKTDSIYFDFLVGDQLIVRIACVNGPEETAFSSPCCLLIFSETKAVINISIHHI